jgi:hypothetical protein
VRLASDGARVRAAPEANALVVRELDRHTALRVLGGSGEYFRVRLPDGTAGYVAARLTETLVEPFASQTVRSGDVLRVRPDGAAPLVVTLDAAADLPVLGRYEDFLYVRVPGGPYGWVSGASQQ